MLNRWLLKALGCYVLMAAGDTMAGGGGNDTQAGGGGNDTQAGGGGNDTQAGGNDTQAGGAAGDKTKGGGGKSLLENMGKGGKADDKGGAGDKKPPVNETAEQKLARETLEASEKDTRRPPEVPSKFWDPKEGKINSAAWAKSHGELETRMRVHGLPPKSAEEYKLEIPAEMKAAGLDLTAEQTKGFKTMAHELGLTQKQYEGVMGAYFRNVEQLANQASQFSEEKCRAELLKHYKTEEQMTAGVKRAYRAFMAFAEPGDQAAIDTLGNIPAVVRAFDKVGKEMGEDPGVHPDQILAGETLEHLMRGGPGKDDSPYWNATDPRHKSTKEKVKAFHEASTAQKRRQAA